jgi:hypothetical protein
MQEETGQSQLNTGLKVVTKRISEDEPQVDSPAFQSNRPFSMGFESPTKAAMKLLDKSKMSLGEFINLISECDLKVSQLTKKLSDTSKIAAVVTEIQVFNSYSQ